MTDIYALARPSVYRVYTELWSKVIKGSFGVISSLNLKTIALLINVSPSCGIAFWDACKLCLLTKVFLIAVSMKY